jgi:glycosyltransferase involved in cell wall biosynthesis
MLGQSVKNVDTFIAPSSVIKDIHHRMGLDIPISIIPNFVPEVGLAPAAPTRLTYGAHEGQYFLFVGRLEKLKGLQTLIPIFRRYKKAKLLIAGTGGYEAELRRLANGDDNVHFLGFIPQQKLQFLYRNAAAVIVPSICFEVFPLVVLEAFRQQTAVIVRNIGGMPEIIEESGGGFVYDTEEELLAAMERLLAEPSYRDELGRHGHETYRRNWTPEAHLKPYFDLIRGVVAKREEFKKGLN